MELTTRQRRLVGLVVVVVLVAMMFVGRVLDMDTATTVLAPARGDVVMLYYPRDPDRPVVKRVIAMEGDTVRIEDGLLYINGVLLPGEYVPPDFRNYENSGPLSPAN